mmetsp:Transcript_1804/g.2609  ORF Transcript_1804/g.2609 Transcript_1804/m.2609 type:complete len:435 (+) Transcript_1804:320-1624(+)
MELLLLGGTTEGSDGRSTLSNNLGKSIEVTSTNETLVGGGLVTILLRGELVGLELRVGGHTSLGVLLGEAEHAVVEGMETGKGDELELVAEGTEGLLEGTDLLIAKELLPVEGRRAVVGEELAGELGVDGSGELLGLLHVGLTGLEPDEIGIGSVGETTSNGGINATTDAVEALSGALTGAEGLVTLIDVGGEEVGTEGIGTGDDEGGNVGNISGETSGGDLLDELVGGDEDLATHVAALLGGGELILEMNAGGTGLDHTEHKLIGVEDTTETGLSVSNNGSEEINLSGALGVLDLISALEGVVDPLDNLGDGVSRVEGLIGVGLVSAVVVTSDLPAGKVDSLKAGGDHLNSLVTSKSTKGRDVVLSVEELPELLSTDPGKGVLDGDATTEALNILLAEDARDTSPTVSVGRRGRHFFELWISIETQGGSEWYN